MGARRDGRVGAGPRAAVGARRLARGLDLRAALVLAALAAAPVLTPGCIYAPFDLGLDSLGQIVEATVVEGPSDAKLLLLRIDGEISDSPIDAGFLGPVPGTTSQVRKELDLARRDETIRGVILRINSPGGGVTASDLVFQEIRAFRRETGRPVVALLLDTAASGGYYIAQAADAIVACPTTVTGSIGVIAQFPDVSGLGEKIGVRVKTIASGPRKDLGNPFRQMAPEEAALLQKLIDDMHERFVQVVAEGRKPGPGRKGAALAEVRKAADGRIFTSAEAERLGLIDRIGYFADAQALALKLASLPEARVVAYERKAIGGTTPTIYSRAGEPGATLVRVGGSDGALEAALGRGVGAALPTARGPLLQYLWIPAGAH